MQLHLFLGIDATASSFINITNRYLIGEYKFDFKSTAESPKLISFNVTIPAKAIISRLERSSDAHEGRRQ